MNLLERINARQFTVAVVGLGYVGLPLAVEFAKAKIKTFGIDVDPRKIDSLNAGKNYIQDLDDAVVAEQLRSGMLVASTDYAVTAEADVIYICVPTPFTPNKEPDISYIMESS